jgi:hypothetical protein
MFEISLTIGIFLVVMGLVYFLERRVKKQGVLFTGSATRGMRLLAIILGLLFAGISLLELTSSDSIIIWFPIIAIALIGYGLGADQLLGKLQQRSGNREKIDSPLSNGHQEIAAIRTLGQDEMRIFTPNRFLRFIFTLAIILTVSAVVLYGAIWAATHPSNPFAIVYVISIIVFFVIARFFDWVRLLKNISNLFK